MRSWLVRFPSRTAGRLGVGAFGLACVLLLIIGWISLDRMADLREASESVDRALMIREATGLLLSLVKDAETGQRGFVITGDRRYLEPYDAALAAVPQHLERLRGLTAEIPRQQASLATLEGLIRRELAELRDTIATRERGGFEAAARMVATGQGKQVMDEIRGVIAEMRQEETRVLAERRALAEWEAWVATSASLGGLAAALGLLVAAGLLLNRAIVEREREHAARTTAQTLAAVLAESEAWLRVTLTSIGDAVIATDERGRVKLMNRVAEWLTGWSEADASGRPLADVFVIINEHSRLPVPNPTDTVLRERTIAGLANHTILTAKDGHEVPIDDSAAPILAPDGTLLGAVLVFRDISGRRRLERERAALLESERKAGRAKDVFLALLSHELRTPLTSVLGWVKMLRTGRLDKSSTERAFDVIERNTFHQSRLIDDLLDVSRIAAGKLALEIALVDPARLVEIAVDSIRPAAEARGIQVTCAIDRAEGLLRGDAARLQQVFGNLLANAVKFTPTGGRVDVRLDRAQDRARVSVSDTGRGIDLTLLPHVFEPFRQATAGATSRANRGLGLGLAIVRHLIELHGGTVHASSEGDGKGATFTVELSLAAETHDAATKESLASDGRDLDSDLEALRGLRVLVVDDDPDIRELVTATLAHYGAQALAVGSVAEAHRVFAKSPPDVLICDIALPDEDGVALIEDLRRRAPDKGGATPAIAVSAYVHAEDRDRALGAGFQRYLPKPVDVLELIASVAALHQEHRR
jgi:PAS domain S-box-containing protein